MLPRLLLSLLIHGAWRDPEGFNFPQSKMFNDFALLPNLLPETRLNIGFLIALAVVAIAWVFMTQEPHRIPDARRRIGARGGQLRGHIGKTNGVARHAHRWRDGGPGGRGRSRRAHRPVAAVGFAGLRIRRDHRGVRRPAASFRHTSREPADVVALSRRRIRTDGPRTPFRGDGSVPGHAAVLPPRGRRVHQLSPEDRAAP